MYNRGSARKNIVPRTPMAAGRMTDDPGAIGRRSTAIGRMSSIRSSIAGGPRNSLAMGPLSGRPSTLAMSVNNRRCLQIPQPVPIRDNRASNDRNRQAEMVSRIYEFLRTRDLPFTCTEQMIRAPTNKNQFKQLFEALLREVDENFAVSKLEDEVPKIMAALGFPHQIKHSTMLTITAPLTWPTLLMALDWLITDVIQVSAGVSEESFMDSETQSAYTYFVSCYVKNQQGCDDYTTELDQFRAQVMESEHDGGHGVEESYRIHHDNRLKHELSLKQLRTEVEEERNLMKLTEERLRDLIHDIEAIKKNTSDWNVTLARQEQENREQEIRVQKMIESLANIQLQIKDKTAIISTQKMSGDEVRAINNKLKKLKTQLAITLEEYRAAEEERDELQPRVFKQKNQILSDYKKFLSKIQVFCEKYLSAEQLEAIDWLRYEYDRVWEEYSRERKSALTDLVEQLRAGIDAVIARYRDEARNFEQFVEDKNREIQDIETRKLEEQKKHNLEMEQMKRTVCKMSDEARKAEMDCEGVRDRHRHAKAGYDSARDSYMKAREHLAEIEKLCTAHHKDLERAYNDLMAVALDKVSKLISKMEQIVELEEKWLKLGENVFADNQTTLKALRQKERASFGTDVTNRTRDN